MSLVHHAPHLAALRLGDRFPFDQSVRRRSLPPEINSAMTHPEAPAP